MMIPVTAATAAAEVIPEAVTQVAIPEAATAAAIPEAVTAAVTPVVIPEAETAAAIQEAAAAEKRLLTAITRSKREGRNRVTK